MKIKSFITILLISAGFSIAQSQTNSLRNVHNAAHQQLMANAKSRLDKSVIKDFIKQDVEHREIEALNQETVLSKESTIMLQDLLKEAHSHLGKHYRSGAKGPYAFDCSGFSGYVYRQFGYNLKSSSKSQYSDGVPVKRNELRAGDLVFFTGRNRRNDVGHVGIVVSADPATGDFKFIHASTSKGIRIDNCSGYYASRYVGARRIITE